MKTMEEVRMILGSVLQLGNRASTMGEDTKLLGSIPELDSMSVVNLLVALEERFDFSVADDDVTSQTFETLGSLAAFVDRKLIGDA